MEKDLDKELYNNYLSGEKEAFELLYNKYKSKIQYFIYNIIKDYQKAEDLTQETFIYVMQNEIRKDCTFKYHLYLVAKSKACNYLKVENRRDEISRTYLVNDGIEKDIIEAIEKEETKKEVLQAIDLLDEKYKNAIYLVNVEGLSYEETAEILGETLQNTKTLVHRGKKKLKNILLRKGFENLNKVTKVMVIVAGILLISSTVFGITTLVRRFMYNDVTMNPTYESSIDENTVNNLWVGTMDLAWKQLEEQLGVDRIQIEGDDIPQIAADLNASTFSKEMLNEKDYEITVKPILNGYEFEASLNKELEFLEVFDNFEDFYRELTFGDGEDYIKYFGINDATREQVFKNVEILFFKEIKNELGGYLPSDDFAVKLRTKEGDEIILYRTDEKKSFDEYYEDIQIKTEAYEGAKEFTDNDRLLVPYTRINGFISYNELLGKTIAGTGDKEFIKAIQNVNFYLNESGCNLSSKATIADATMGISAPRYFYFTDTFVLFMKEADAEQPYFALKVDNDNILERINKTEYTGPAIFDYTKREHGEFDTSKIQPGEYKFYEDDEYEYYYPTHKTEYVMVSMYPYGILDMTAEEALKEGAITMDVLDRFGIEYIKKEK